LLRGRRAVHLEPFREDLVERLLEVSPRRLAREIHGLLDASSADDVRALEFPERLVQWVLRYLGRAEELLVGPRLLAVQGEELLLLRLEPGPLRAQGGVPRDVGLRRPVDALRRPDALDQAF